jgi:beta-lactamase class A
MVSMFQRKYPIFSFCAILILGVVVGWFGRNERLFMAKPLPAAPGLQVRVNPAQFKFINPPLYSDDAMDTSAQSKALNSSLTAYISSVKAQDGVDSVSVYFRDLNGGRWTGVNVNDDYSPSSMLKVLTLMAVYNIAENNPAFLSQEMPYNPTDYPDQHYKPDDGMTAGSYTVQQLVNAMIINSDNDALESVMTDSTVENEFDTLYSVFRLPAISTTSPDFMSAESYSAIFRVLYNSSIFPWDVSEKMLTLLSETTFTEGLVAGVPQGTIVAHKFGENTGTESGSIVDRELHDCGIIYYPQHPYLLCAMTKGRDFPSLENVISGLSKLVYNFVNQENQPK